MRVGCTLLSIAGTPAPVSVALGRSSQPLGRRLASFIMQTRDPRCTVNSSMQNSALRQLGFVRLPEAIVLFRGSLLGSMYASPSGPIALTCVM